MQNLFGQSKTQPCSTVVGKCSCSVTFFAESDEVGCYEAMSIVGDRSHLVISDVTRLMFEHTSQNLHARKEHMLVCTRAFLRKIQHLESVVCSRDGKLDLTVETTRSSQGGI